jgi:hypothetical protein
MSAMVGLRRTDWCDLLSLSGVIPVGYVPALQTSTRSSKMASEIAPPAME